MDFRALEAPLQVARSRPTRIYDILRKWSGQLACPQPNNSVPRRLPDPSSLSLTDTRQRRQFRMHTPSKQAVGNGRARAQGHVERCRERVGQLFRKEDIKGSRRQGAHGMTTSRRATLGDATPDVLSEVAGKGAAKLPGRRLCRATRLAHFQKVYCFFPAQR